MTLIKVEITLTKGISGHISFMLQSQSLATQESAYLSFLNIRMLKIVLLFVGRDACSALGNPQTPVAQRVDSTFYLINHYSLDTSVGCDSIYPLDIFNKRTLDMRYIMDRWQRGAEMAIINSYPRCSIVLLCCFNVLL